MRTYTVHEPQPAPEDLDERAARLVFVREGFSWLAFITPVLWLLFNRLWLALLLFLLAAGALFALVGLAGGSGTAMFWTGFLINLAFGFEARDIYRHALARKGYSLIGVVTGRDLEDCERRFLAEWLPGAGTPKAAGEPAQTGQAPAGSASSHMAPGVMSMAGMMGGASASGAGRG